MLALGACGGGSADSPVTEQFYPEAEAEWELVWQDEFDGDVLDANNRFGERRKAEGFEDVKLVQ